MNRMRGFAAVAGMLGLGAMAAGLVDSWPESVRALAVLALLFAVPPYLLARLVGRLTGTADARLSLRLSLAVLAWLSALALWTAVFAAAGASFRTFAVATIWGLLGLLGGCAGVFLRPRAMDATRPAARGLWILVATCALFAALAPHGLSAGEDGLDHVGYIRHMLTDNTLRPQGVLAAPADATLAPPPDPRKGVLHATLALASWISSSDPLTIWRWFPVFMFPVAALAMLAFNSVFISARAWRVGAAVLILLTFDGSPLRFAGASAHGENLAALWGWVFTAAVVASARQSWRWPAWFLLSAGGVMVHLGVALHVLVLAATIIALGGVWGIAGGERIRRCMPLVAGVAVAMVLRRADLTGGVNVIHSHTQGVMFVSDRWFVASLMELLRQQGLLFLGGLVCLPSLLLARSRSDARMILAAAAVPFLVSFVPWIATWLYERGSYMVFRSLLQVPAFAAIMVAAAALVAAVRRRQPAALALGVPAVLLWSIVFVRPVPQSLAADFRSAAHIVRSGETPDVAPALIRAVAGLPSGSVVLSDPATSYVLSAHSSHRFVAVYQQHGNPRDRYALDRIQAVRDVLSPYVMPDVAAAACRRFAVDYVVVNGSPPRDASQFLSIWRAESSAGTLARMESMSPAFTRVDMVGDACIYRFDPSAALGRAWSAQDQPVKAGTPWLEPCVADAPNGAFRITGLSVDPARAIPGDTVRVTMGYVHDTVSVFRLPVLMHVRFDHEALHGGVGIPGEKHWRRIRDARTGARSRFRADLRPGHGVFAPDLWPVGFDLFETFSVVVPPGIRTGEYRVEVSLAYDTHVPNFHVRDLFLNRDHYSGNQCATLTVVPPEVGR